MAHTDINAYVIRSTAEDDLFTQGQFIGELKIQALPDHASNRVQFKVAGYRGQVAVKSPYTSCKWSIPIEVRIGFGNTVNAAKSAANNNIFHIPSSDTTLNGYYPTNFQTYGYEKWVGDESSNLAKGTPKKYFNNVSHTVDCNAWGTPNECYLYFRCRCYNPKNPPQDLNYSNSTVWDKASDAYRTLDIDNSSYMWLPDAFPYLCNRAEVSLNVSDWVEATSDGGKLRADLSASPKDSLHENSCNTNKWTYTSPTFTYSYINSSDVSGLNGSGNLNYNYDTTSPNKNVAMTFTATSNVNGKKASSSDSYDLRAPELSISNFSIDGEGKVTFTVSGKVNGTSCYLYDFYYSWDNVSWTTLDSNYNDSKNYTYTLSPTISSSLGEKNLYVKARRQSNHIWASTLKSYNSTRPTFSQSPVVNITSNTAANIVFTPNISCEYEIYKTSTADSNNKIASGSCTANTSKSIRVSLNNTSNEVYIVRLINRPYSAIYNEVQISFDSRYPEITSVNVNVNDKEGSHTTTVSLKDSSFNDTVNYLMKASLDPDYTETLQDFKLTSNESAIYWIKAYRSTANSASVTGYSNLNSTHSVRVDTRYPEVSISNVNVNGIECAFRVASKVAGKTTPLLCNFSYKLQQKVGTTWTDIEGYSGVATNPEISTYTFENIVFPAGIECRIYVEATYPGNGLKGSTYYDTIIMSNLCKIYTEEGPKNAVAYVWDNGWKVVFPCVCNKTGAVKPENWIETTI
jgi:hypothetical protein